MDPVDQVTPLVRHQRLGPRPRAAAAASRSLAAARRCPRPVRAETTTASGYARAQGGQRLGAARSALLITISSGTSPAPMSASTARTARIWPLGIGIGAVDHVHQQVGLGRLLQGRGERLDQVVRQVPDEADGVGQGVDPAVGGCWPAGWSDPGWRTARPRPARRRRSAGSAGWTCRRWCSRRWPPTAPGAGAVRPAWSPGCCPSRAARRGAWRSGC